LNLDYIKHAKLRFSKVGTKLLAAKVGTNLLVLHSLL